MSTLDLKVEHYIKHHQLIKPQDHVIVGLSGGMDSICLMDILLKVRRSVAFQLHAAHMDHMIRKESFADAQWVAAYCQRNGIILHAEQADVPSKAKCDKVSLEVAARDVRHAFFERILMDFPRGKLALAHHMNDKAETMLMRMFRGTSLDGMDPMPMMDRYIIRPLMCATRNEVEAYCLEHQIQWREDQTNRHLEHMRNYIRHRVVPLLVQDVNPSIVETLCQAAQSYGQDSQYLMDNAEAAARAAVKTDCGWMMPDEDFIYLHPSVRKRVIKILLKRLGCERNVYSKNIEAIEQLFHQRRTGAVVEIPGDYEARGHIMGVELVRLEQARSVIEAIQLNKDGITRLSDGSWLECEMVPVPRREQLGQSPNVQYMDSMMLPNTIVVRSRQGGDRIAPLGAGGSKKLKDYFIDQHVSRWERDFIPLLMDGDDVIWAIGYSMGDKYKVTEDTAMCLKILFNRNGEES